MQRNSITPDQNPFDVIYILAKIQDEAALREFLQLTAANVNVQQNYFTPISLLAAEGDDESVQFLLDKFGGSKDWAGCGYARGKHVERANEMIAKGASKKWVLCGYAQGGHVDEVNLLMKEIKEGKAAALGYLGGNSINKIIVTLTDDKKLRNLLIDEAIKKNLLLGKPKTLQLKMEKANTFIRMHDFNHAQTDVLVNRSVTDIFVLYTWFLQGIQLVQKGEMLFEIYCHVTVHLASLSVSDSMDLCEKISFYFPKKFLMDNLNKLANDKSSFFSDKAKQLFFICDAGKTKQGLATILDQEKSDAFYKNNLERHHLRLK